MNISKVILFFGATATACISLVCGASIGASMSETRIRSEIGWPTLAILKDIRADMAAGKTEQAANRLVNFETRFENFLKGVGSSPEHFYHEILSSGEASKK